MKKRKTDWSELPSDACTSAFRSLLRRSETLLNTPYPPLHPAAAAFWRKVRWVRRGLRAWGMLRFNAGPLRLKAVEDLLCCEGLSSEEAERFGEELISEGGYFSRRKRGDRLGAEFALDPIGRPVITLGPGVSVGFVIHEMQHFRDWKALKDRLRAAGGSPKEAHWEAEMILFSSRGVRIAEARALAAQRERSCPSAVRSPENVLQLLLYGELEALSAATATIALTYLPMLRSRTEYCELRRMEESHREELLDYILNVAHSVRSTVALKLRAEIEGRRTRRSVLERALGELERRSLTSFLAEPEGGSALELHFPVRVTRRAVGARLTARESLLFRAGALAE